MHLRDEEQLENTLLPSKSIKLRYLKARENIPVTLHDIEKALEYLYNIDCQVI